MAQGSDLSQRQQAVYDFIVSFCEERSYPPTVREIGAAVGLKSTSNVHMHLKTLERKGYIRMDSSRQRTISVVHSAAVPANDLINVPIVGAVAAGNPILAFDQILGYMPLPSDILHKADARDVFILNVEGESMIGAGILNGDQIVVHKALSVENGDIAVARVSAVYGEAATVKRIYRENDFIRLQPENSSMKPILVPNDGVEIIGKVIALYRRY